jgi:outer membrane protein assembly factor BamB
MSKMKFKIVIIIFVFFISCKKEEESLYDSNGVATKLSHLWNTSITDDGGLTSVVLGLGILDIQGNVLVGGGDSKGSRKILNLNQENGKILWSWKDIQSLKLDPNTKDPIYIDREAYYVSNNKMYFNYGSSSYCLNLDNGTTTWKYKTDLNNFSINAGIDNYYFSSNFDYFKDNDEKLYTGSIDPYKKEGVLLIPNYTSAGSPDVFWKLGRITQIAAFKKNEDIFIAFTVSNPIASNEPTNAIAITELNLYNFSQKKWVYQKVVINPYKETSGCGFLTFKDERLYFASSKAIHCNDAMTGKEVWRANIGTFSFFSSMAIEKGRFYAACEDRFLYCLDTNTGQVLWKEQNTGTCSPMSYLNGVLYYLGGGDGKLHAVDADTGKHLWKLISPDVTKNSGAFFYGLCAAVPGKNGKKGRVIGTTGLNAYCFEAVR